MKRQTTCALFVQLLLAVPQAAIVVQSGHDYAKWDKEISAYTQADRINPPQSAHGVTVAVAGENRSL